MRFFTRFDGMAARWAAKRCASEMKSDHAKDRDSKLKYIEKAVFCVSFAVGETLSVKPGKVVAGQEPEKTNEFLQMLARVVKEKIDTKEHVKRVLNGMTIAETSLQGYRSDVRFGSTRSQPNPCPELMNGNVQI